MVWGITELTGEQVLHCTHGAMKVRNDGQVTLTKQEEEFLIDLIANTGIEIWNSSCTKRILGSMSDDGVKVCPYDNPLHGQEYKTVQGAINNLIRSEQ